MIALHEGEAAHETRSRLRNYYSIDAITLTHGFFLNMDGFCLKSASGEFCPLRINHFGSIHSGNVAAQGDVQDIRDQIQVVSKDQIDDCANADTTTKLIACVQGLWLLGQVISRLCQRRAITLLEVSGTAYVCCAVIANVAWWKKPQDCNLPIIITCSDQAMFRIKFPSPYKKAEQSWMEFLWASRFPVDTVSTHSISLPSQMILWKAFDFWVLIVPAIAIGTIHIASWNIG